VLLLLMLLLLLLLRRLLLRCGYRVTLASSHFSQ
jgi:hypothetical protein